jgi:PHS family inorganic phosphate transporter-like MFS transporter
MMASVFAMQGLGQLGAAIVMIVVTAGFKGSLESAATYATCKGVCGLAVDKVSNTLSANGSF